MKKIISVISLSFLVSTRAFAADVQAEIKEIHHLIREGNYQQALTTVDSAIKDDPQNVRLIKMRGNIHFKLNDYQSALSDFNTVVQMYPNQAKPYVDRAIVLYAMKNYDAALSDVDHALRLRPDSIYAQALKEKITNEIKENVK